MSASQAKPRSACCNAVAFHSSQSDTGWGCWNCDKPCELAGEPAQQPAPTPASPPPSEWRNEFILKYLGYQPAQERAA